MALKRFRRCRAGRNWKLVTMPIHQAAPHLAGVHEAVRKREPRRMAGVEPDADRVPLWLVGEAQLSEQRLDRLRLVEGSGADVPRDDAQSERLIGIGADEIAIVRVAAVEGLGLEANFVKAS